MRDIFSQSGIPGHRPHVPKVGLVDPIALSKDRKKAPLSAPS